MNPILERNNTMKDFIVEIYSGLLQVIVVVTTGFGFYVGYNLGDETSVGRGLLYAAVSLVFSAAISGHLFTQIRVKELLEEQLYRQREAKEAASRQSPKLGERKCPYCAELVKKEAIVCRFCGRDIEAPSLSKTSAPLRVPYKEPRP